MNEIIIQAIKDYEKAAKECTKLNQAAKAAQEAHTAAVMAIKYHLTFKEWRTSPEYIEMQKKQEAAAAMESKAKAATATKYAAGYNAAAAAKNAIREAIEAGNDKRLFLPTHYKKFEEAIKEITGDDFYISHDSEYSIYITYRGGDYGHSEIYLCDKKAGAIDPEYIDKHRGERSTIYTLAELKAEAKKAVKIAAKMKAQAEKLEKECNSLKAEITSHINCLLPSFTTHSGLRDSYKLF